VLSLSFNVIETHGRKIELCMSIQHHKENELLSRDANELSRQGNKLSREANALSKEANTLTREANLIAAENRRVAAANNLNAALMVNVGQSDRWYLSRR
jgi:hypothetical protein